MSQIPGLSRLELTILPSASSSQNDFDFLQGQWTVHNRKLKSRLNGCKDWLEFDAAMQMRIMLLGIGNTDTFNAVINGKAFEGMTLRLFDPATRLWSIYWADSNKGTLDPPVIGSFDNRIGTFYGRDVFDGKPIILKFNWDATDSSRPVWSQAFSDNEGKTWEWNWYMYMKRIDKK